MYSISKNNFNLKEHIGIEKSKLKFNSCSEILDKKNHEYNVLEKEVLRFIIYGKEDQLNEIFYQLISKKCVNINFNN